MNEETSNLTGSKEYGQDKIKVLDDIEHVRKRTSMYIGSTSSAGLHHLVWEILDNSIDEVLAGYCKNITVELMKDNYIRVDDDGRGIPTEIHEETHVSTLETVLCSLRAGGKFDNDAYKVAGGLHGVGASVVNALSDELIARVSRDNKVYEMSFSRGVVTSGLKEVGVSSKTGTSITFLPDKTIFDEEIYENENIFDFEIIRERVEELSYLNRHTTITIIDSRVEPIVKYVYMSEGGIAEFLEKRVKGQAMDDGMIIPIEYLYGEAKSKDNDIIGVEIAFCYTRYHKNSSENFLGFVNRIKTIEGGKHIDGFKSAIGKILLDYAEKNEFFGKKGTKKPIEPFKYEDTRDGLFAIVSMKHPRPQFEGQTKTKLGNVDAFKAVSSIFEENFTKFLDENPEVASQLIQKVIEASANRIAADKIRNVDRKSALDNLSFASKLADCRSKNPEVSELFIVEGDSAGGSAKQGRNSEIQAILPLRGKVLNVEKVKISRALENNEIISLIKAIGTGYDIRPEDTAEDSIGHILFDIQKARYNKIVIMTDADVDGAHIRILLLTFFYRRMKGLIESGFIYFAQPPLYKIQFGNSSKYAYSDEEKDLIISSNNGRPSIQRYKGLGEMDPVQLWETTMDPDRRILLKVTIDDAILADRTFSDLMGEDVEPRRKYIQERAKFGTVDI
ncbi:MAG: DNA gyrase subunit B [Acholeplasmatales bacterium]|nr:DNA gyrase subunit B [Acholeplasmatales bacterium]